MVVGFAVVEVGGVGLVVAFIVVEDVVADSMAVLSLIILAAFVPVSEVLAV